MTILRPVNLPVKNRLTESAVPTIYGCEGLFDICGDADLMSLSFEGSNRFLDWIGWERTDVCQIIKNFITWVRPSYSGETASVGYLADPCADPNGVEWGGCDFQLLDFARLRRGGPVRDITKVTGLRLCEQQPRYRLDGTQINNDREYDMRLVVEALLQDLKRMIVNGNGGIEGQFYGFNSLVKTGYLDTKGRRCSSMDSVIIDMNGNDMDGGAGMTWNGQPIDAVYNFIDILLATFRAIRQRISWAPALAAQPYNVGDIVLVAPTQLLRCILNAFTCWSVCPGQQYREANLNTFEARSFRDTLMGGAFGDGRIYLDGVEIPLIAYDWGLINGPTTFDAFLLTGQIGNLKTIQGQYNDMAGAASARPDRYSTDGGRLLSWSEDDMTCEQQIVEWQPRLLSWAPWAQVRFQDITCRQPGPVLSPDPTMTSFFPETSFNPLT